MCRTPVPTLPPAPRPWVVAPSPPRPSWCRHWLPTGWSRSRSSRPREVALDFATLPPHDGRVDIKVDKGMLDWLLEGDPSIRWRVIAGLAGAPDRDVNRERSRIAHEGWGARLLAQQDRDGGWGDGVYSPKWTSTTYTLLHLMWLGLMPGHHAVLRGCAQVWDWQSRWRKPETCVVSILVRLTSAFGYADSGLDGLVKYLLDEQLSDGGWNCHSRGDKAKHSSFHTSIQ